MGLHSTGEVVFLPFPFSDLSRSKLRPVLLIADAGARDWISCQITSNPYIDPLALAIDFRDFSTGGLPRMSYIRPAKLFAANESLFSVTSGVIKPDILGRVRESVIAVLES